MPRKIVLAHTSASATITISEIWKILTYMLVVGISVLAGAVVQAEELRVPVGTDV